jgi:ArsR family transcriptional regulator, virulence genes transcriptional regulator
MKMASLAKLEANASNVARMLGVLANKERIRIVCRLARNQKELSIAELSEGVAISQSALSQHLTKLRKGGIVSMRRAGHNSFYRLADPRAAQLAIALIRY